MSNRFLIILAVALGCVASADADDTYTLTTDDFSTAKISIQSIDSAGLNAVDASGAARLVPFKQFVSLAKPAKTEPINGLVLCTLGGDRLVGAPQKLDGQSIVWFASGVGSVAVPIEQCTGVLRNSSSSADLSADRADDQAKLVTGDTVKGIVTDVTEKGFVITPAQGDPVTVAADTVQTIFFAAPPGGRKPVAASGLIVRVAGGTSVTCQSLTLDGGRLSLALPGGRSASIPLQQVTSIENAGGAVSWLSSRVPTVNEFTPYFQDNFPARFDRTVTGGPIRFGGTTYAHGIGVHSRSKLVFAVQPGDVTFRTRYAIDGNLGYADVDVRVSVDDKVIHQAKAFHAGVLSPVVQADVSGAKTVTLEVDYGGGYDVQDRLNWIEPAMIRAATTQP